MTNTIIIITRCLAAILIGIIEGNGAVYFFNKMPGKWLTDYGDEIDEELANPTRQRIKSNPWKYAFTIFFVIINIKIIMLDYSFVIAANVVLWLLVEMSIADIKYSIVPDQLIMLLAISTVGFIEFNGGFTHCIYGSLIGFGTMLVIALIGKIIYKRDAMGGGDIKLFAALGLFFGTSGIIIVIALTFLISAAHFIVLLLLKKVKRFDAVPMVPYIMVSATLYFLYLWPYSLIIYI